MVKNRGEIARFLGGLSLLVMFTLFYWSILISIPDSQKRRIGWIGVAPILIIFLVILIYAAIPERQKIEDSSARS